MFSLVLTALALLGGSGGDAFQFLSVTRGASVGGRYRSLSLSSSIHHPINTCKTLYSNQPDVKSTTATSSSALFLTNANDANIDEIDPLIYRTSKLLKRSSWFSWWSQVILTVISSVTFLFARNVMETQTVGIVPSYNSFGKVASKFFLPGLGIITSSISIIWTWGQRRLARRFIRRSASTSHVEAANLLRRVIKVGVALNLVGLLLSVLGSQYIVGTLVAKSMTSFIGGAGAVGGVVASQTLQPLDVLVVQANTNILSSHFVSLACLLWLSRMVDLLDPPSMEDDIE